VPKIRPGSNRPDDRSTKRSLKNVNFFPNPYGLLKSPIKMFTSRFKKRKANKWRKILFRIL